MAAGYAPAPDWADLEIRLGARPAIGERRTAKRWSRPILIAAAAALLAACATGAWVATTVWWSEPLPDGSWKAVALSPAAIVAAHPQVDYTGSFSDDFTLGDAALSKALGFPVSFPVKVDSWECWRPGLGVAYATIMANSPMAADTETLWQRVAQARSDDAVLAALQKEGRDVYRQAQAFYRLGRRMIAVMAIPKAHYREEPTDAVPLAIDLGGITGEWYDGQTTRDPGYAAGEAPVADAKHKPYRMATHHLYWDAGPVTFFILAMEGTELSPETAAAFAREFIKANPVAALAGWSPTLQTTR
jgi:hypothetical protein